MKEAIWKAIEENIQITKQGRKIQDSGSWGPEEHEELVLDKTLASEIVYDLVKDLIDQIVKIATDEDGSISDEAEDADWTKA